MEAFMERADKFIKEKTAFILEQLHLENEAINW